MTHSWRMVRTWLGYLLICNITHWCVTWLIHTWNDSFIKDCENLARVLLSRKSNTTSMNHVDTNNTLILMSQYVDTNITIHCLGYSCLISLIRWYWQQNKLILTSQYVNTIITHYRLAHSLSLLWYLPARTNNSRCRQGDRSRMTARAIKLGQWTSCGV